MRTAATFIDELQARGRYHFTTEEAVASLGGNVAAVRAAVRRLAAKGALAQPRRGFHVIVPAEYRALGCLPGEQFVPQLMDHLGDPYYVALLSAAAFHGAAHQRPQVLQVMVPRPQRSIACGKVRVDFVVRSDMRETAVVEVNTPRGHLRVSSPEATALELVGYAARCGGLDNVATVMSELAEALTPDRLAAEARRVPVAWAQRLGYLLELVDASQPAHALDPVVIAAAPAFAALAPGVPMTGASRSHRWRIVINASVEPDL